ncbi:MAG: hypothetical protein OQL06_11860 [Gammaproteobacteria bacterium]|nr:hypothetical protein [Gammaproteobacteria bacterium]
MQIPETWLAIASLVVLCGAVLGGAATAFVRLADKNTPVDIGLLHGRAGVFGAVLLVLSVVVGNETAQSIKPVIGLLILTVLAGVALYFIIRRKGILPRSVILIHGAFAVSAVYTLLFGLPF